MKWAFHLFSITQKVVIAVSLFGGSTIILFSFCQISNGDIDPTVPKCGKGKDFINTNSGLFFLEWTSTFTKDERRWGTWPFFCCVACLAGFSYTRHEIRIFYVPCHCNFENPGCSTKCSFCYAKHQGTLAFTHCIDLSIGCLFVEDCLTLAFATLWSQWTALETLCLILICLRKCFFPWTLEINQFWFWKVQSSKWLK